MTTEQQAAELQRARADLMEAQEAVAALPEAQQAHIKKLTEDIMSIVTTNGSDGFMAFAVAGLAVQVSSLKAGV